METASAIANILQAVGLLVGVGVAWRGLQTWRDQMRGQAEHAAACALLRCTLRLRDILLAVRDPLIGPQEIRAGLIDAGIAPEEVDARALHAGVEGRRAAYEHRWKEAVQAQTDLGIATVEAEVLLGPDARERVSALGSLAQRLRGAISVEFCRQERPADYESMPVEKLERFRNTAFGVPLIDGHDLFQEELESAVAAVEAFARPFYASGRRPSRVASSRK